jgi:hypothetical protein
MNTLFYVAETDGAGRVICVWVADKNRPGARPIRNPNRHLPILHDAHCAGASKHAIQDWLLQQGEPVAHY